MKVSVTFRGLDRRESARATRLLERTTGRLERLVDSPPPLRAVVEADGTGLRVQLSLMVDGDELLAQSTDHDLKVAIAAASERLRTQLVKRRRRWASQRSRPSSPAVS